MTTDSENHSRSTAKYSKSAPDVVSLVDDLLRQAIASKASDIHFEPSASALIVKYRLDGVLHIIENLPKSISDNIIARLKVLGHLLTYRNDIPQEGRIQLKDDLAGPVLDQRLAIYPTIHGQRAVIRLFYEESNLNHLDILGFSETMLSALKQIVAGPQGVLLVTGPAGSGKSTTLAALLRYILRLFPGKSIVALEDPVERHIEGVTQVQISPHGEMTFPTALRSLLRQDPEVLMLGEIRDAESARIAIEAGLTGHLLLSTLHSGSPATGLLRLLEMGIEPYQITSSISAVVNQRLLRKLCEICKQQDSKTNDYQSMGCERCFQTGYAGRALVAEMVQLDGQLRKAILAKADLDELEHLLKTRGHMSMLQDGMRLVHQGITTVEEVHQACGQNS